MSSNLSRILATPSSTALPISATRTLRASAVASAGALGPSRTREAYREATARILDSSGASARLIADQLGHARISMTQDVYMGRRAVGSEAAAALEAHNPDSDQPPGDDV